MKMKNLTYIFSIDIILKNKLATDTGYSICICYIFQVFYFLYLMQTSIHKII